MNKRIEKTHVLYLSYDGMTDSLGQSQVLPYLKELSKNGVTIHLISCEKPEKYDSGKAGVLSFIEGNDIVWYPLKYRKSPPIISTLADVFSIKKEAEKIIAKHKIKIVHCRSYITALVGEKLKKKHDIKFLFDMRGFYADERVDGNIWKLTNPIYKWVYNYFKKKEKDFFRNADYSVSLTYKGKEIIESWNLAKDIKIEVIPCCADLEKFDRKNLQSEKIKQLKQELNIREEEFVICYLGSVGTWYMLPEMLDFFSQLLIKKPNSKFLFISSDSKDEIVQEATKYNIPSDKIIVQKANHSEVPAYASIADVSIFFIKPVFSKSASSPTKQGELMGLQIPVICNAGVGDTDMVVNKYQSGWLVNSFTREDYNRAIDNLENILALDKEKIRKGAEEFYSLKVGVERYLSIYNKLSAQ
jgi:glycosyltransferase involved in cell wall biosynthesis